MRITVIPIEGEPFTVTTTAGDRAAWETYAMRHKWPLQPRVVRGPDGPTVDIESFPVHQWQGYLCWRALYRGQADRPTFDDWLDTVDQFEDADEQEDTDPEMVPTPAALSPA